VTRVKAQEISKCSHSRGIDKALWTKVDQEVVEKTSNKSPADGTKKRGPDPILTAVIEHCGENKRLKMTTR
jgi:hypothetical protein